MAHTATGKEANKELEYSGIWIVSHKALPSSQSASLNLKSAAKKYAKQIWTLIPIKAVLWNTVFKSWINGRVDGLKLKKILNNNNWFNK